MTVEEASVYATLAALINPSRVVPPQTQPLPPHCRLTAASTRLNAVSTPPQRRRTHLNFTQPLPRRSPKHHEQSLQSHPGSDVLALASLAGQKAAALQGCFSDFPYAQFLGGLSRTWADELDDYYDSRPDMLPEGLSMVNWWGACLGRFSTWHHWLGTVLPFLPRPFPASESLIKVKDMFRAPPSMVIEDDHDPVVKDDAEGSWDSFLDDAPDNYEPDVSVE
ncbi:hypothetical protein B0H17DRAFT_1145823 [Mycena rosella]|uniref:Uncharacterized protein n=1 Tax=Mycena rosella TaxID=1033263 RepID=A0AAD7CQ59_MYCRO|nr:hypothetical protein B0H17DRAFT_1145823 [Mycena rosella]